MRKWILILGLVLVALTLVQTPAGLAGVQEAGCDPGPCAPEPPR